MATPDGFDWEAEGRRLGERLDALHAIAVLGQDPEATALVALGIARAQASRRRVALGDLLGDAAPFQEIVPREDPHGLVDSFLYGISLNRVALRVPGDGELFFMPTGTEAPVYEEILPNPRWRRLAAGFREVGALLVIAAPADAPQVAAFVDMLDGAVLVGEGVPRALPLVQVISYVREPRLRAGAVPPSSAARAKRRWSGKRVAAVAGALLALIVIALGAWLAYPMIQGGARPAWMTRRDSSRVAPPVATVTAPPATTDSAAGTAETAAVAAPVDPADSDSAAAFSVALTNANTPEGAILYLRQNASNLPATTYAPISLQGVRWYRVLAGAYLDTTSADSLLEALHARGLLDGRSGSVVRTPFAFLIDSGVAAGAVQAEIARYLSRRIAVYPLFQPDGSARLYAGAFESPAEAAMFAESLRAAGVTPVLAYRIGRVF